MGDFKFNCKHCQQSLEAPQEMFGTVIDCPACNGRIEIPQPAPKHELSIPKAWQPKSKLLLKQGCPGCGKFLAQDEVLCTGCGFNLKTGEKVQKQDICSVKTLREQCTPYLCDVCSVKTSQEQCTRYTAAEFKKLVSKGFEPDEAFIRIMVTFSGRSKQQEISDWEQKLVAISTTDWLLCMSCASRAATYMPKKADTDPGQPHETKELEKKWWRLFKKKDLSHQQSSNIAVASQNPDSQEQGIGKLAGKAVFLPAAVKQKATKLFSSASPKDVVAICEKRKKLMMRDKWEEALPFAAAEAFATGFHPSIMCVGICFDELARAAFQRNKRETALENAEIAIGWYNAAESSMYNDKEGKAEFYAFRGGVFLIKAQLTRDAQTLKNAEADLRRAHELAPSGATRRNLELVKMVR